MNQATNITQLLNNWTSGDPEAGGQLAPLVYDELHRLAQRIFRGERPSHTLQPTALVHEVYSKLVDADVAWQDRAHFFALAARMMRRLLVNYATQRNRQKRGGDALRVTLHEDSGAELPNNDALLLDLDRTLTELSGLDERKAELIQLKFFGGLTGVEIAEVTGLSSSTIDRELRLAKAWMRVHLSKE